jgi:lysozyme
MISEEMQTRIRSSLVKHEGETLFPYIDSLGNLTIGIGYNLTGRGLTQDWVNTQFLEDVDYFQTQLSQFPWYHQLNEDRQIVLIDMCFMGFKKFLEFTKMLDALAKGQFDLAADEMLNSEWASQVKGRATDLANGMRTGVYAL